MSKETDIIKKFGQFFKTQNQSNDDTKIKEKDLIGYMDITNVCMIIPLKKNIKSLLNEIFELSESKIPELDYIETSKNKPNRSKYSTEYLKPILELCKQYETFTLELKEDYPLRLTTEDFIFILAPRVEND